MVIRIKEAEIEMNWLTPELSDTLEGSIRTLIGHMSYGLQGFTMRVKKEWIKDIDIDEEQTGVIREESTIIDDVNFLDGEEKIEVLDVDGNVIAGIKWIGGSLVISSLKNRRTLELFLKLVNMIGFSVCVNLLDKNTGCMEEKRFVYSIEDVKRIKVDFFQELYF